MIRTIIFLLAFGALAYGMEDCQHYYDQAKEAYQKAPQMKQNHENQIMGVVQSVRLTRHYYQQYRECLQKNALALKDIQ